jgi:hypothetical protein
MCLDESRRNACISNSIQRMGTEASFLSSVERRECTIETSARLWRNQHGYVLET